MDDLSAHHINYLSMVKFICFISPKFYLHHDNWQHLQQSHFWAVSRQPHDRDHWPRTHLHYLALSYECSMITHLISFTRMTVTWITGWEGTNYEVFGVCVQLNDLHDHTDISCHNRTTDWHLHGRVIRWLVTLNDNLTDVLHEADHCDASEITSQTHSDE